MAQVSQRKRALYNPPRKLSDKQIKFFGTAAQKAGLARRRAKSRKNAPSTHRRRAGKKNPGEIVVVSTPTRKNPKKGARTMARKAAKKRARPSGGTRKRTYRRKAAAPARQNPPRKRSRSRGTHHRRGASTNPGLVSRTGGFITNAAYLIVGAVGSKAGTQAVLGADNTGFLGYGANIAFAYAIGKLVGMFTKNKQAENSATLGGILQVVLRFLIDQTPYGSKLKDLGIGDYQFQAFVVPQRLRDGLNSAAIDIPQAWRPAPQIMPAAAAGGGSGVAGIQSIGRGLYSKRR